MIAGQIGRPEIHFDNSPKQTLTSIRNQVSKGFKQSMMIRISSYETVAHQSSTLLLAGFLLHSFGSGLTITSSFPPHE